MPTKNSELDYGLWDSMCYYFFKMKNICKSWFFNFFFCFETECLEFSTVSLLWYKTWFIENKRIPKYMVMPHH